MTNAYTHANDEEIAALYRSGETGKSIASRFGITDVTVFRALERQGVGRRVGHPPTTWEATDSSRRDLVAAYEGGESILAIARRLRIHTRRVTQILDESGLGWRHPGGKRRFSDEQAAEFARAYQAGEGLVQIGRRYGVAAPVIRRYLIRAGIPLRPVGAPAFWTEDRKAEAIRRYQAGEQLKDIATTMGCGTTTLTRTLVELGVHEKKQWWLSGEAHHSWRGGRIIDQSGYARVRVPDADRHLADVTRTGYMMEHRLVMARLLGRRLLKSETVHHIDSDRQNNEPGNLQLRQGKHGKGAVFRCASCGSHDIEAVSLT
jgi:transposase-like protein